MEEHYVFCRVAAEVDMMIAVMLVLKNGDGRQGW